MKLLAPLKKFILFWRQPRPSVFRVRVRPKLKIGDDFSILSASRLPRCFGTVFASARYRNYPRVHRPPLAVSPPWAASYFVFPGAIARVSFPRTELRASPPPIPPNVFARANSHRYPRL